MKMLSDFKDADGIVKASEVLSIIMNILADQRNLEMQGESNPVKMFSAFFRNSPDEMMNLFAILSEENPQSYHCDGSQALENMLVLANDSILLGLFISAGQKGDAKSSASVSGNIEE